MFFNSNFFRRCKFWIDLRSATGASTAKNQQIFMRVYTKFIPREKFIRGITFLEVIISIAIGGILIAIVSTSFSDLSKSRALEKDASITLSYIEKARNQTINASYGNTYGLKFASSTVTIFPGTTYTSSNASNTVYTLGAQTIISSVSLSNATTTFYFQKITGKPSATGTIVLTNTGNTKSIIINSAGLSEIQ